ncbi:shikimate dehydrogenase [Microbacterium sp. MEC084]|uniref:shikimate dehydrogenase n=1 Tax=unclassified Microbacterium TaxID=2609290 RepID=UPI0006F43CA8|nr:MULTISPECIES: shikimate dehydrogenase [unclassified Microbacterium]KQZ09994.1 shikimate dehydrogenase [Microbacterium sp. Root53]MCD1267337.1 shikimate dehydrogenase [Microbacterium sp. MEC084]
MTGSTRLAVWGDPIAHSRSPQLHGAAYARLGLDWTFERVRVPADAFDHTLASLDDSWRGLAVTMPLKEHAWAASGWRDRRAELTGAVNTLLLPGADVARPHGAPSDAPIGFNTDVGGIVAALGDASIAALGSVRIVGAGATSASALVAAAELGARTGSIVSRRPERAASLVALGERMGLAVTVEPFGGPHPAVDLTISALPGGAELPEAHAEAIAMPGGPLFDVAYHPWPSHLAARWTDGAAIPGHGMLLHQAVLQVRIFATGSVEAPLPSEDEVRAEMRSALMGD